MRRVKSLCSGSEHERNREGEEASCNGYCTLESVTTCSRSFSFLLRHYSSIYCFQRKSKRGSGSEEGYYCSPQAPFVKGSLLPPLTPHHTRRDTQRHRAQDDLCCGGTHCHYDDKIAYEGGGAGLKICAAPPGLVSRRWFPLRGRE